MLNWNGGDDTPHALASLEGIETICVDNGSTDGSDAEVERRFPDVELVRNGANLGFAGGNNVGIRRALERGADWVLLVNNDAVVEPGIAEALDAGCRGAARRGPARLQGAVRGRADGDVRGRLVQRLARLLGPPRGVGQARPLPRRRATSQRADGAAMAISRAALERVGLLDEQLFAYVEDVDLSLRVREAGFAVVFVPDAVVRHKGSASTGGSASTHNLYYSTRNTIVVAERYRPLPPGLRALRRGVVVTTHLAQAATHPLRAAAARSVLEGWRDARAGRLGQRSSR